MKYSLFVAWRFLNSRIVHLKFIPRTSILTLCIISLSTCIPIVIMLFTDQIHQSIQQYHIHQDYHLQVSSFEIDLDEILSTLQNDTNLKKEALYITPFYRKEALIQHESGNYTPVMLRSTSSHYYDNNPILTKQFPLLAGTYHLDAPFHIVASNTLIQQLTKTKQSYDQFVKKLNHSDGVHVTILAQQNQNFNLISRLSQAQSRMPNLLSYQVKVVGIFQSDSANANNMIAFSNLKTAQILFNIKPQHLFNTYKIGILLKDIYQLKTVQRRLESKFPQFNIQNWESFHHNLLYAFQWEKQIMTIILIVVLFGSVGIVLSTNLNILISSKTKEIAILKTLGISNRTLRLIFSMQGILLSILGIIIGTILSLIIVFSAVPLLSSIESLLTQGFSTFSISEEAYHILPSQWMYVEPSFHSINLANILLIDGFSLIIGIMASFIPSRRVLQQRICDGIKESNY